jgi:hypothetical protein
VASSRGGAPSSEGSGSDPANDLLRESANPASLVVSRKLSENHETPQGERARLDREKAVLIFSLSLVASIFALCVYTGLFNSSASEADKKWSFAVIGAMAGPFIGYVVKAIS